MKKNLFYLFLGFSIFSFSQETFKPEFPKRPYYIEAGKLKSLDKEVPSQKGVYNTKYILKKEFSSVAFEEKRLEFIFEYEGENDVENIFKIVMGEVSKKGRVFNAGGFKVFGGKNKDNSKNEIPFEIKRIKGNIYKIILENIESGEYAFVPQRDTNSILSNSNVTIYTFSVK